MALNKDCFTQNQVKTIFKEIKIGKASGADHINNEMLKYAQCDELFTILTHIFNQMYKHGYTPENFNISLVAPIPKKGECNSAADYRPISVSSAYAMIYERLILLKLAHQFNHLISKNQFGYKNKTSSKHAYFIVNETIRYYNRAKTPLYLVSLACQKAFDKLWRAGLFYKLIGLTDDITWRAIVSYYSKSKIMVKMSKLVSECFGITEGVKQGGVLSSFLFNFFLDKMIERCLERKIGAKIASFNVSIVAYCDDVVLMSPTIHHLNILLEICHAYSIEWKLQYNQKKSTFMVFDVNQYATASPSMNGVRIERQDSMIYLGLPLGDDAFISEFFDKNMSKSERSLYSLYGLGCRPHGLNPKVTAFIYKQFS